MEQRKPRKPLTLEQKIRRAKPGTERYERLVAEREQRRRDRAAEALEYSEFG